MKLRSDNMRDAYASGERRSLCLGATSKCCHAQEGQATAVTDPKIRAIQALPDKEAFYKCLTMLRLSGMVPNLIPIKTESALTPTFCLHLTFTPEQLGGIYHIATDNPTQA